MCATKLIFETLIDDSLVNVTTLLELKTATNKKLISIINDFEDGKWHYEHFKNYIWDNIAQTALSARERRSLVDKTQTTLVLSAKNLRLTDNDSAGNGSEIAEIFLYGIMKDRFNALPVVPKIFYKQNTQDNAKGADSVHIVVDQGDFTLWLGEAKFYNSIEDERLATVIKSVLETLGTEKLKKENSIITNVSDINSLGIPATLKKRIMGALNSMQSIDTVKSRLHIPIMILHECKITAESTDATKEYRKEISRYHLERAEAYFKKQIAKSKIVHKYAEIYFHLILFPVPNKKEIVDAFMNSARFYRGER